MKKIYTLICAVILFCLSSQAQYTGGTYTAVMAGAWHNNAPTPIWSGAEPPQLCNNCLVQLNAPSGSVITLNAQISFTGGSNLVIAPGVTLQINNSGATNSFTGAYDIFLTNQLNNFINFGQGAVLNAANAGPYDGVLTSFENSPTDFTLTKAFGIAPLVFDNNTVITQGNGAAFGTTFSGPGSLSGFGSLPIILASFTATLNDGSVDLAWQTSLEENSDHIAIESSADAGSHWRTIGTVTAQGTSHTPTNYTFTDTKPAPGTDEYRLKMVDKDGKFTYSPVRTVRLLVGAARVFPNPAQNYVNVTLAGSATETLVVRLFNQTGQLLQERSVVNGGGTTVALSVSGYPQGNYLIEVTSADGSKQASKLLISK
ncbi:T9SS type A sorting domain-containing protein [Puia dinghuensis]|uniref:Secretion system C-terminal sorting domain-containing protein n=1 Tax=Puia dinghuensis TaxID=1792502 RepID=A0A8J2UGH3_9BACT|nr:T9SS type A sorting domain-containing protein [Puia dinghuensis]GGB14312.1 hypothetical protein GCM10011511_42640 [Puia dinghuensis]